MALKKPGKLREFFLLLCATLITSLSLELDLHNQSTLKGSLKLYEH